MSAQGRNVILALCVVFLLPTGIFAIPADVELIPEKHAVAWGAQSDWIFQRDFNKVEGEGKTSQYFFKASYGLTERFFVDGKIGMGDVRFNRADGVDMKFSPGFAGGYGFRYLLCEPSVKQQFIFGFQHISVHPFKDTVDNVDYRVIWDEWQGTFMFRQAWKKLSLFVGPQYSAVQLKYKQEEWLRRLKCEDVWGACAGLLYQVSERAAVSIEGRAGAEQAGDIGIRYTF